MDDAFHGDGGGRGVLPDELVDAVAGERPAGPAGLGRLEQGCVPVAVVAGELKVIAEYRERGRVDRDGTGLGALSGDPEVRHAPVLVERSDREAGDLVAPESVVEEDSQEGPVAPGQEALPLRSAEEPPCLGVGERRGPAFVRVLHPGPPDARDGVLEGGVGVTEVAEEGGDGRELPPPGRRTETALLEHLPPGDDVGPADESELAEAADPEHRHELPHITPVRPPGVRVVDVGEPLGRRRHVSQLLELGRRDQPPADIAPDRQFSRRLPRACRVQLGSVHARSYYR